MVGRNPGYGLTQGEILSDHFKDTGYPVISVSSSPNRYARLADIVTTLIRHSRNTDILMLQVYAGRSFIVEDIASWLGQRFKHRIVMVLRNGEMPEFMSRFPVWTRRVLGRADALVAPSGFLARAIIPYGLRAKVIPNLLDLPAYPHRHRQTVKPRLLWMRTFDPDYNPTMAVRVLSILRSKMPEATLVMAGQDKGNGAEVRRLCNELRLDGAVRFPGFLDMGGKINEGQAADIFLNTNKIDNTPVSVLEACAMGLPVVATNVGGIADLLTEGETGLLVPDNNVDAMVKAIYRLLNESGLSARLSTNGRQVAQRSSWKQVYPQWKRILDEIMGT